MRVVSSVQKPVTLSKCNCCKEN